MTLTIKDYQEQQKDVARLTREIDVAINGKNAAKQASLCDILAQLNGFVRQLNGHCIHDFIRDVKSEIDRE